MLTIYSNKIHSNVVLTTFAKHNVYNLPLPKYIETAIYESSFSKQSEFIEKIQIIQ